jgi:hypothetical protein
MIYKSSVRTSQGTHNVIAMKTNRLMLFRETIAVYCGERCETKIHSVLRIKSFSVLMQVVHMVTTGI